MARALNQYPDLLTVEEAAEYLRISRALGYQLTRCQTREETDGLRSRYVGRRPA
jgi:hypothetical protein